MAKKLSFASASQFGRKQRSLNVKPADPAGATRATGWSATVQSPVAQGQKRRQAWSSGIPGQSKRRGKL